MPERTIYTIIVALALLAIAYLVFSANSQPSQRSVNATPHVMLGISDQHGSGVHIGDGYILTAAHVVVGKASVPTKASNGSVREAIVLWSNKDYDIALARVDRFLDIDSATLSCKSLDVGTHVRAYGNPWTVEFVSTEGTVVGPSVESEPWGSVVPVDITLIPGMSGGGVLDDAGDVVGISVSVLTIPIESGYRYGNVSIVGMGYVVPSSVACMLMGRT